MRLSKLRNSFLLALVVLLSACAMAPQMKTPVDVFGAAFATETALANTITEYVNVGLLSPDKAKAYSAELKTLNSSLNEAVAMYKAGHTNNAMEMLGSVNKVLLQLQMKLQAMQKQQKVGKSNGN